VSAPTLYGYWRSSATWRVRIGLHLKGIPFRTVPVHLVRDGGEQNQAEHLDRNPMGQVPVLSWMDDAGNAYRLTQSLAILEFIEETWTSDPGLLPGDTFARCRARALAEIVNSGIQPFQNLWLLKTISGLGADGREVGRTAIAKGLHALQDEVELAADLPKAARPGDWLVGDAPTVADACLIPQLYNARRFGLDVDRWPLLAAIDRRAAEHPAFIAAHPDAQPDAVTTTA
jgi:maleylpyruvate isomerase